MEFEIQPTLIEKVRAELLDICAMVDKSNGLSSVVIDAAAARLRGAAKQLVKVAKVYDERALFVRESNDFAERYSHKLQITRDILSGQSVKQVAEKYRVSAPAIANHLANVAHHLTWTCGKGSTLDVTFLEDRRYSKWGHFSDAEREALLAALELLEKEIALRREGVAVSEIMKQVWGISKASLASSDY
jgi:hypothetical protein